MSRCGKTLKTSLISSMYNYRIIHASCHIGRQQPFGVSRVSGTVPTLLEGLMDDSEFELKHGFMCTFKCQSARPIKFELVQSKSDEGHVALQIPPNHPQFHFEKALQIPCIHHIHQSFQLGNSKHLARWDFQVQLQVELVVLEPYGPCSKTNRQEIRFFHSSVLAIFCSGDVSMHSWQRCYWLDTPVLDKLQPFQVIPHSLSPFTTPSPPLLKLLAASCV